LAEGSTPGFAAALELFGAADLVPEAVEQADMFGGGKEAAEVGKGNSTGGRPRGARNRRTQETVAWLLQRFENPLEGLMREATRSPREIAVELELWERNADGLLMVGSLRGGALLEVWKTQQAMRTACLPFINSKQPIAIDTGGKVAGVIVLGDLAGLTDDGEGQLTLTIPNDFNGTDAQSDGQQSDAAAKSLSNNERISDGT
jgi:hypothetical protein